MILLGLIDRRAYKRQRELFSGLDIVRAAADLEGPLLPCVDRCQRCVPSIGSQVSTRPTTMPDISFPTW